MIRNFLVRTRLHGLITRLILLLATTGLAAVSLVYACSREKVAFDIISGSENRSLEPLIEQFAKDHDAIVRMHYKGSVDMMLDLQRNKVAADAVWPASSIWLNLGDRHRITKHGKSIMYSPVVFGIAMSKARELGFIGRDVRVADILKAVESGKLSFAMTSASQSNSGASAYLGFLYALCGSPEVLMKSDLNDPALQPKIKKLLAGVNRSSGSSGWLKELFLKGGYDAMVNYESLIIEANQELAKQGKEPLLVVYPVDGIVIADSPLAYVDHGDARKEELFRKLQAYLLENPVQQNLVDLGRRTAFSGNYSPAVWKREWGIYSAKVLSPIKLPAPEVIYEALLRYQTLLRKPSNTVFVLDFSGSMHGNGATQLKSAMRLLLDPSESSKYLLQSSPDDRITVIPFNDGIIGVWEASARDREEVQRLMGRIASLEPRGGTDMYTPASRAIAMLCTAVADRYFSAVVLMTDGMSNTGPGRSALQDAVSRCGKDIPVFSIEFGDAKREQLEDVSGLTRGKVFDGRKDLVSVFRDVKGYN
jgi:Ca-activated chloride channel family protein